MTIRLDPEDFGSIDPGSTPAGSDADLRRSLDEAVGQYYALLNRPAEPMSEGEDGMTDDERFKAFRDRLLPREGGFVDNKDDPGGPTKWGISQYKLLKPYNAQHPEKGYPHQVIDLTPEQRDQLYREEFYDAPHIGRLAEIPGLYGAAPELAEQMFDAGVLHTPVTVGKWLQRSLDEALGTDLRITRKDGSRDYDGIMGPLTREAVAEAVRQGRAAEINDAVVEKRLSAMKANSNVESFRGWLPRAESFRHRRK